MLYSFGPGDIRHVNEPVDAVFNFDECAEVSKRSHFSSHSRANVITNRQRLPRISADLFQAEADSPAVRISLENNCLELLSNREQLRGMLQTFGPGHFCHVHETLDPRFDLDERAVVGEADHSST